MCSFVHGQRLLYNWLYIYPVFQIAHERDHQQLLFYLELASPIKRVTVNMPLELHRKLKMTAVAVDMTMNDVLIEALELYLQQNTQTVNVAPNSALN